MTMQAISLYERVVIRRSPYLDLALPGSKVKPGPGNTAIKAALAFFHYTGLLAGADITIYKSVPVRAGMAGGSADAAAVLVGLNELYGARLSMSELCALGVSIGADVPFALMGGTCRVQGLGDLIKALPPLPECWFTVVMPGYGISTPEAFAAYDKVGSSVHPDCAAQEAAIRAGDLDAVCAAAGNALEECSGAKDNEAIKNALRENGAVAALMTGSGARRSSACSAPKPRPKPPLPPSAPAGRRFIPPSLSGGGGGADTAEEIKPRLRTTSQSGLRPPAPLVGEPLLPGRGQQDASKVLRLLGAATLLPGQWHCEAMTERLFL